MNKTINKGRLKRFSDGLFMASSKRILGLTEKAHFDLNEFFQLRQDAAA